MDNAATRLYRLSSCRDAAFCGNSISAEEISAALFGAEYYVERFGVGPEHALLEYAGSEGFEENDAAPSEFAGKPGHRWGWIVKMFGWSEFFRLISHGPGELEFRICEFRNRALRL